MIAGLQVADRFHLHQNLLEAIKKALNYELPATISIPHDDKSTDFEQSCKKIESNVDNCPVFQKNVINDLPDTEIFKRRL